MAVQRGAELPTPEVTRSVAQLNEGPDLDRPEASLILLGLAGTGHYDLPTRGRN
jgi:hypothetical protein